MSDRPRFTANDDLLGAPNEGVVSGLSYSRTGRMEGAKTEKKSRGQLNNHTGEKAESALVGFRGIDSTLHLREEEEDIRPEIAKLDRAQLALKARTGIWYDRKSPQVLREAERE
jgi:hypothetical protein